MSRELDGHEVRTVQEIVAKILAENGERAGFQKVVADFGHQATHEEWSRAAAAGLNDQLRKALRSNGARRLADGYVTQGALTFEEHIELAVLQARRGRAFVNDVRRLAVDCQARHGKTFDAEAIIAEVIGQASS